MRLRQKLVDLADSVKGFFGAKTQQDNPVEKLERLKVVSSFRTPPALKFHQAFTYVSRNFFCCMEHRRSHCALRPLPATAATCLAALMS